MIVPLVGTPSQAVQWVQSLVHCILVQIKLKAALTLGKGTVFIIFNPIMDKILSYNELVFPNQLNDTRPVSISPIFKMCYLFSACCITAQELSEYKSLPCTFCFYYTVLLK
jgi:hypothetical protein